MVFKIFLLIYLVVLESYGRSLRIPLETYNDQAICLTVRPTVKTENLVKHSNQQFSSWKAYFHHITEENPEG